MRGVGTPTAIWKIVLLGIIAAVLIALGAGMILVPDPAGSAAIYRQATPCTSTSTASDNCYAVVPITVVSASADHLRKGGAEEHVIVQAPSGPAEIVLPWQSEQDQVLLAGATGTVDVYRGQPVVLAVGGYRFDTLSNPFVQARQTGFGGWIFLILGLGFAATVVLTIAWRPRYRRAAPEPVTAESLQQQIDQLARDGADPQVLEQAKRIQQRIADMQARPLRGQITQRQTLWIVVGCLVAVVGALLLRGARGG